MIGSLAGSVTEVGLESVLLAVGGVGYRVFVLPTLRTDTAVGRDLTLFTHLHVREDDLALFGFPTVRELAFFQLLLRSPGVGPKTALGVMSIADVDTLIRAITSGDASLLTQVAGIGRKTAERIVVELRATLAREHPELAAQGGTPHADVVAALVSLGYTPAQAREAARQLPGGLPSVEEGIRAALKALGQRVGTPPRGA